MGAFAGGDPRGTEHEHEVAQRRRCRDDEHCGGEGVKQVAGEVIQGCDQRRRSCDRGHSGYNKLAALPGADRVGDGECEGRKPVAAVDEGGQREPHADSGRGESRVVPVVSSQPAGHYGRGKRPDVD